MTLENLADHNDRTYSRVPEKNKRSREDKPEMSENIQKTVLRLALEDITVCQRVLKAFDAVTGGE